MLSFHLSYDDKYIIFHASRYLILLSNKATSVTSGNDSDFDFGFEVYPNPAVETINIRFVQEQNSAQITVLNYTGAEVLRVNNAGTHGIASIKTSEFPAGIYLIKIQIGNSISVKPIVIVK
jgi:hypothetical protein